MPAQAQSMLLAGTSLENGLLHVWPLDGNSNDVFVTGNGTDTAVTYTTPKLGTQCAAFNGTTSNIQTASLLKPLTWTMNCWINSAPTNTETYGAAWAIGNLASQSCAYWTRTAASPTIWTLRNNAGSTLTATIPVSTWTMSTVTFDGTNARAYTNGALVGGPDGNYAATMTAGSGVWAIGGLDPAFTTWNFQGLIDEPAMWNRALTAAEVTALYNAGAGNRYPW